MFMEGFDGMAGSDASANGGDDSTALNRSTHFVFGHKIFQVDSARFVLTEPDRIPALRISVGEHEASLLLDSLCNEFKIFPESEDGRMLEQVIQGLRFVKDIRPGDTIPRELLDGTASWSIADHHGVTAKNKLMWNVLTGASGKARPRMAASAIAAELAKPRAKALIEQGLDDIAVEISMGKGRQNEVLHQIDGIARELAYIEALRDRYARVHEIKGKLSQIATLYASERQLVDEIQRVKVLMEPPIKEFSAFFDQVDAQMRDIVKTLKTFNTQISFIREVRDELHQKMLIWDEAIEAWEFDLSHKTKAGRKAVQFTYRFVAYNFPQSTNWL